jgi:hypothetical protein
VIKIGVSLVSIVYPFAQHAYQPRRPLASAGWGWLCEVPISKGK